MKHPWRGRFLTAALIFALTPAGPAPAYFQTTVTEGILGQSLNGVWLVEHHVMPEFRSRVDREKDGVPIKVGPIAKENWPLTGDFVQGVQIVEVTNQGLATSLGLFEGDIITQVNVTPLTEGMKSYEEALAEGTPQLLFTVRRPRLAYTHVEIAKLRYQPEVGEVDGQSRVLEELVRLTFLDVKLPFAAELEEARRNHKLVRLTKEHIEPLKESWWKLETRSPSVWVKGDHRFIAADEFDSSLRKDDNLKGALFGLISTKVANPMAGTGGQEISAYGFRDIEGDKIRGTCVQATFANAPFPISIEFKGAFTMHKLADYSDKDSTTRIADEREKTLEEYKKVKVAPDIPEELIQKEEDQQ